jgi:CHAT domain-containing protein/tetratricopeptide (TPR) repeat protein
MTRRTGVLAVLAVVAGATLGCAQHLSTQPPSTPSVQATVAEATRLNALMEKLYSEGKFQEAIPFEERSLALRVKVLGPRHPDVAESLNNLAGLYKAQGAYAKAEPLYIHALDIKEKALGAMHPLVANGLNNLASLYSTQGAYAKAEPLYIRALDIREKVLGVMHPHVASSLQNLAALYYAQGAYAKAEPLIIRALGISEKSLGATHPLVAKCLATLAALHEAQGAYTKAEPLYLRALDIREKLLGPTHPDVATSLNDLGMLYQSQGAYAKAEPLFVRALDIREKALGPTHPDVADSLNNLGMLYHLQGAHAKAEPLYIRALGMHEKVLGAMHPDVATNLNNLAMIYKEQGAYAKAEPLLVRALDINEKALGVMHPDVALSLDNLALLYQVQGAYAKAEPLCIRALDIREKTLGAMHPEVALSLDILAVLYQAQGTYSKAEPLLVRALDINEKALGVMHPDVAEVLMSLTALYQAQGEYAKAEPLLLRALAIREKALGTMHPLVASSLNRLAALYAAQGAYAKVEPLLARAGDIRETQLRLELVRLSEPRKRALMMLMHDETERVVSLHADAMRSSRQALELALTTTLRRKGRALDSLADNQISLHANLTPALRDKLSQLAEASSQLSTRMRAPFDPQTAVSRISAIAALRTRIDDLEADLNAASTDFRVQSKPVTVETIQATLPRGAALIEFVRYRRYDARQLQQPWQEERYVAYVLPQRGPPQCVMLGEAALIDAGIDAALAAMPKDTSADATSAALRHLDALVFAPLRGHLINVSHVILSPDGKLNLVPFEALIDPQGHYELEQRLVSYVTSGRDLLRLAVRRATRSSATIFATPDYGPPSSPPVNGLGTFRPLDGATAEAADLPAYFVHAQTLTGGKATKTALAATLGPAVLHIATHGFYTREAATISAPSNQSTGSVSATSTPAAFSNSLNSRGIYLEGDVLFSAPPPPPSEDPTEALDRAGLALAGANVSPDGIVSARELASYDWWGTQLVVLSACETGVGAVPSGEGVYGMRRALVLAGAESQVVSLWNVNDASTRELMRAFYGELARGTGRAEALRRAKLRLLRQPHFAHPYYWAAFIPAGDWTPLDPHLFKRQEHGR